MQQTTKRVAWPGARTYVLALTTGLAAVLFLFPASGLDRQPPECDSMFGYVMPCEASVAWVAGLATAGLVGLALWRNDRRSGYRGDRKVEK